MRLPAYKLHMIYAFSSRFGIFMFLQAAMAGEKEAQCFSASFSIPFIFYIRLHIFSPQGLKQ